MKLTGSFKQITGVLLIAVSATAFAAASDATYTTQDQKLGYTLGYDMGKGLKQQGVSVDMTAFEAGYTAGNAGTTSALSEADMKAAIDQYRQAVQAAMKKEQAAAQVKLDQEASVNEKASQAYLAKVSKEDGVKQISNGVYYKVLTAGNGPIPKTTDMVTVNYEGQLMNGQVFDSSYKRGKPVTFPLNAVIPGWTTAVSHMPVGSTWMIYLSPEQAYGKYAPSVIGPNQALTFKVELIKIDAPNQATSAK